MHVHGKRFMASFVNRIASLQLVDEKGHSETMPIKMACSWHRKQRFVYLLVSSIEMTAEFLHDIIPVCTTIFVKLDVLVVHDLVLC